MIAGALALAALAAAAVFSAIRPARAPVAWLGATALAALLALAAGADPVAGARGGLLFPAFTTLDAGFALAECARSAGAAEALAAATGWVARGLGRRAAAAVAALAPWQLDLGDPAGAAIVTGRSQDLFGSERLRGPAGAVAVAGGTFGGALWLAGTVAGEASGGGLSPTWMLRLAVWPVLFLVLLWLALALPRETPREPGAAPRAGPLAGAALAVLVATGVVATLRPDPRLPAEAIGLAGAAVLFALGRASARLAALEPAVPPLAALALGSFAGGAAVAAGAGEVLRAIPAPLAALLALAPAAAPLPAARSIAAAAAALLLELLPSRGGALPPEACAAAAAALAVSSGGRLPRGATLLGAALASAIAYGIAGI